MVRSIGGLLDRLAPAMQRALFLHLGLPYPSTDDDPPTKQLKETLKTAFSTADAAFIRTSDALLADLNILASPIGETYVAQELTTSEPPVGDLFPGTLEGEHDRALWLIINDPIAAADIIAVASFDSRFEKPAHWAGVRIPNARPGFWDELSDENVLKGVFERSRAKGTVPPTRLGVEYHSRRALRHAGQTIQATLSEGGKRETPILTGADGKHKRTPIQHTRQFHVVIDADQETFDVVSLDLAKGVRTKLFQDLAEMAGVSADQLARLSPRELRLDQLARTRDFPCSPSRHGFERVELTSLTIFRSDVGALVLNTTGADRLHVRDAWNRWSGQTHHAPPFGKVTAATLVFDFAADQNDDKKSSRPLRYTEAGGFQFRGWREYQRQQALRLLTELGLLDGD